jgi:hypothetical protein
MLIQRPLQAATHFIQLCGLGTVVSSGRPGMLDKAASSESLCCSSVLCKCTNATEYWLGYLNQMSSDLTEYETNLAFLCRDILGIGARQKRLRETHSVLFAGTFACNKAH